MATSVIERQSNGEAIFHHCNDCGGAIAVENVEYGNWRTVKVGVRTCQQRKVTITCDFCERTHSTIERRFN